MLRGQKPTKVQTDSNKIIFQLGVKMGHDTAEKHEKLPKNQIKEIKMNKTTQLYIPPNKRKNKNNKNKNSHEYDKNHKLKWNQQHSRHNKKDKYYYLNNGNDNRYKNNNNRNHNKNNQYKNKNNQYQNNFGQNQNNPWNQNNFNRNQNNRRYQNNFGQNQNNPWNRNKNNRVGEHNHESSTRNQITRRVPNNRQPNEGIRSNIRPKLPPQENWREKRADRSRSGSKRREQEKPGESTGIAQKCRKRSLASDVHFVSAKKSKLAALERKLAEYERKMRRLEEVMEDA